MLADGYTGAAQRSALAVRPRLLSPRTAGRAQMCNTLLTWLEKLGESREGERSAVCECARVTSASTQPSTKRSPHS
jgi:hypothetical protein